MELHLERPQTHVISTQPAQSSKYRIPLGIPKAASLAMLSTAHYPPLRREETPHKNFSWTRVPAATAPDDEEASSTLLLQSFAQSYVLYTRLVAVNTRIQYVHNYMRWCIYSEDHNIVSLQSRQSVQPKLDSDLPLPPQAVLLIWPQGSRMPIEHGSKTTSNPR